MALYDFRCAEEARCSHRWTVRMNMRENLNQARLGFPGVECPMCGRNQPIRVIKPETLLVDCFSVVNGTFDSSDKRHPPEMDGLQYGNRREWDKTREAWGIASKGEIDPIERRSDTLGGAKKKSVAKVTRQVIGVLKTANTPLDWITIADSCDAASRGDVKNALMAAAKKGLLTRTKPGVYALPSIAARSAAK
jgi:hypothetical protein